MKKADTERDTQYLFVCLVRKDGGEGVNLVRNTPILSSMQTARRLS